MIIYDQPQPSTKAIRTEKAVQCKSLADHRPGKTLATLADNRTGTAPRQANRTGLPDGLKRGIEHLSGISLDQVRVHYNSARPAQLHAYAYAQGTDIHLAPGQEAHLPHEAWHVVQQAQGRVRPTVQLKAGISVNDDRSLEYEADVMGAKALQMASAGCFGVVPAVVRDGGVAQCRRAVVQMASSLVKGRLNVVGERHEESQKYRDKEKEYSKKFSGSSNYWTESQLNISLVKMDSRKDYSADPRALRFCQLVSFIYEDCCKIEELISPKNGESFSDLGRELALLFKKPEQKIEERTADEEDASKHGSNAEEGVFGEEKTHAAEVKTPDSSVRGQFVEEDKQEIISLDSNDFKEIEFTEEDIAYFQVIDKVNEEKSKIIGKIIVHTRLLIDSLITNVAGANEEFKNVDYHDPRLPDGFVSNVDVMKLINDKLIEMSVLINNINSVFSKISESKIEDKCNSEKIENDGKEGHFFDLIQGLSILAIGIVKMHPIKEGDIEYGNVINHMRSQEMHNISNDLNLHKLRGVWKIGDNHRIDMMKFGERSYNLVSRDIFYSDFEQWRDAKFRIGSFYFGKTTK